MTSPERLGRQPKKPAKRKRACQNCRHRKIKCDGSSYDCQHRKRSPVLEPSFLELPCCICNDFDHEETMLICDGCELPYHMYCVGLEVLPPEEKKWFCELCSRVPPVTRPETKLSANKLLPQSLFSTREGNVKGEELDSPDMMQKEEPATQRKQEGAARYVLGICHCRSMFCLTVPRGH